MLSGTTNYLLFFTQKPNWFISRHSRRASNILVSFFRRNFHCQMPFCSYIVLMGRVRVPKRKKKTNWKATNLTSKFSDFSLESSDFSSSGHSSLCRSIEWDPYHHSIRMRCFLYLSDARAISFRCQCQNLHQFAITEQKLFHFWTFCGNFLFDMIIRSDGQLI